MSSPAIGWKSIPSESSCQDDASVQISSPTELFCFSKSPVKYPISRAKMTSPVISSSICTNDIPIESSCRFDPMSKFQPHRWPFAHPNPRFSARRHCSRNRRVVFPRFRSRPVLYVQTGPRSGILSSRRFQRAIPRAKRRSQAPRISDLRSCLPKP